MKQVRCVAVIPRNGYVNRLQAWASASIIATDLDAPLRVHWDIERVCPTPPSVLFDEALLPETLVSEDWVTSLLGTHHSQMPRYLNYVPERNLISLAGHDRGEQAFMSQLNNLLGTVVDPVTIVVIAGGRFHLPGGVAFRDRRRQFYEALPWSVHIRDQVRDQLSNRGRFLGLHIRGTDRSRTAPSKAALRRAIMQLVEATGLDSIFVAADTPGDRSDWIQRLAGDGLHPWMMEGISHNRHSTDAGIDAMVEWCLLGKTAGMVFSEHSSFGHEAAVHSGQHCIDLRASVPRQLARATQDFGTAALTYPKRRWWPLRQHLNSR